RAVVASDLANIRQVEVEQRVAVRMRRQERVGGDDPLRLTAVVSEAALLQQVGGAETLRKQLECVADIIEHSPETVQVHVLPFTATVGSVLGASTFHVFDFASAELPSLAWQETVTSQSVIENESQVRDLSTTHAQAVTQALDRQESLELIRRYAKGKTCPHGSTYAAVHAADRLVQKQLQYVDRHLRRDPTCARSGRCSR